MEVKKKNARIISKEGLRKAFQNPFLEVITCLIVMLVVYIFCNINLEVTKKDDIIKYLDRSYVEVKKRVENKIYQIESGEVDTKGKHQYIEHYLLKYPGYMPYQMTICMKISEDGKKIEDMWPNITSKETFHQYYYDVIEDISALLACYSAILMMIIISCIKITSTKGA